jgi:hypothetical protein
MADVASAKLRSSNKTPSSSRYCVAQPVDCSELLKEEAMKAGLVPSQAWLGKVEQLHMMAQLKHGIGEGGRKGRERGER